MAYTVEADTIVQAWVKAVTTVYHSGVDLPTEYKNNARTLVEPLCVHINKPYMPPRIADDISNIKSLVIREYCRDFMKIANTGHTYTYPNRLLDFPSMDEDGPIGNGDGKGFNQIQHIINSLSESHISRRQIAHTWYPQMDAFMEHCPCLQDVHFYIIFGKLNVLAHFRSNDILDASLSNNNGLYTLQQHVASSLGVECGYLEVISNFAHIYENRLGDAKKVLAGSYKYLSYPEVTRLYAD